MVGNDWLGSSRAEAATDRVLDAAGTLFARGDVSSVGMNEIAIAAGCSRATLYRYFENRESLHTAYVHRETDRVNQRLTRQLAGIDDPRERLLTGLIGALQLVRLNPALSSWFAPTGVPIGAEIADRSEVVQALMASFLSSVQPDTPEVIDRRARWVVRILTSLLTFPGRDDDDERTMLEEFVVPIVLPLDQRI